MPLNQICTNRPTAGQAEVIFRSEPSHILSLETVGQELLRKMHLYDLHLLIEQTNKVLPVP